MYLYRIELMLRQKVTILLEILHQIKLNLFWIFHYAFIFKIKKQLLLFSTNSFGSVFLVLDHKTQFAAALRLNRDVNVVATGDLDFTATVLVVLLLLV